MNDKIYWIWLSRIFGIGNKSLEILLNSFENPRNIWYKTEVDLINIVGEKIAREIADKKYRKNLKEYINYMEANGIDFITRNDKDFYPDNLKQLYDAPIGLYVKGNKELLNKKSIAIIGCRECSDYGRYTAKKIANELSKNNIAIISGLAKGIDTYAHMGSLEEKGKTIAVLGNGLETIYPSTNTTLAKRIVEKGGILVSEYPFGTAIKQNNFPARNRIISGLSDGILVVEAKEKSGTMHTVDFGLEQGKDIFAIPGNITSCCSVGTNSLIKEGATLVTSCEEILDTINV